MSEEKKEMDHSKAGRLERAKNRTRGMYIALLELDDWGDLFRVAASENECIENDGDIKAWLEENDFRGTVWPCRFQRSTKGEALNRKCFTREVQEVFKIEKG